MKDVFSFNKLKGKSVVDVDGYDLGKIASVLFNIRGEAFAAVVEEKNNFNNKKVIVPWKFLRVNPNTFTVSFINNREMFYDAPVVEDLSFINRDVINKVIAVFGNEALKAPDEMRQSSYQDNQRGFEPHEGEEGSEQRFYQTPPSERNNISEELDYDKLKGIKK